MKTKSFSIVVLAVLAFFAGVDSVSATTTNILKIQHFQLTAIPDGNFINDTFFTASGNPSSVVAADVNGDGHLDLICDDGQSGVGTLTVLTNDGGGNFDYAFSLDVGDTPVDVAAADVNGDGKVDLICANQGDDTLTVLTNDGSGGFDVSSTPGVRHVPTWVIAADIYGNGNPALIDADQGGNTLTVLTNTGGGIFVSNISYAVGGAGHPVSVVAADVNNDGKLDLISANYYGNSLTVLTNDGSGGFVFATNVPVGVGPYSVAAADVNGDGKLDLISANYNGGSGNTLTVLTNAGASHFVIASSPAVGTGPRSVTARDVNGDGKVDLICANYNDSSLTVLTNAGAGRFSTRSTLTADDSPSSVILADVSGDGAADIIYSDYNLGEVSVVRSVPTILTNLVSGSMVLAWSTNTVLGNPAASFVLQQNSKVNTTNWLTVTGAVTTVNGQNQVLDPLTTTNRFYRLLLHP